VDFVVGLGLVAAGAGWRGEVIVEFKGSGERVD